MKTVYPSCRLEQRKREILITANPHRSTRTSKPACPSCALLQILHLHHFGRIDPLQHQLRDAIALFHLVVLVGEIEQQHFQRSAVVGVDDPGARVDEVLRCQPGPGRHPAVGALGHRDGQVGLHQRLASGGDHGVVRRVQVVARRKRRAAGGCVGVGRELFDE